MRELTLQIDDNDYSLLKEQAEASHMSLQEYEKQVFHNGLHSSKTKEKDFDAIIEYVVRKNAELYKKLA